jgi:hypothetical protein
MTMTRSPGQGTNFSQQLQPIHARQPEIGQHQIDRLFLQQLNASRRWMLEKCVMLPARIFV